MAFSISSVNRERVPENGGHEIQISGAFEIGKSYGVYIGNAESSADYACYSGIPERGNSVVPWSANLLRCYTPRLPAGQLLSVTVVDLESLETHALSDVVTVDYRGFHSKVFSLRSVVPPLYAPGPRAIGEEP